MTTILSAREIAKSYGGHLVLEAAELSFAAGEIAAVCGENGAGKSTLLRILALLEHPDRGAIEFQGRSLSAHGDWHQARKDVTLVEQNPYAFSGSVRRNVAYGLNLRGLAEAEIQARVSSALEQVGLGGFERHAARTLSGGEIQRMALARAVVCEPKVLILDEPTAHVDAERVRELEKLVGRLRAEKNLTVILATHDHDQACRLADRLLHLVNGRLEPRQIAILPARISRIADALAITLDPTANIPPGSSIIRSLELAGDSVLLRLDSALPIFRLSKDEVAAARPTPGERAQINRSA